MLLRKLNKLQKLWIDVQYPPRTVQKILAIVPKSCTVSATVDLAELAGGFTQDELERTDIHWIASEPCPTNLSETEAAAVTHLTCNTDPQSLANLGMFPNLKDLTLMITTEGFGDFDSSKFSIERVEVKNGIETAPSEMAKLISFNAVELYIEGRYPTEENSWLSERVSKFFFDDFLDIRDITGMLGVKENRQYNAEGFTIGYLRRASRYIPRKSVHIQNATQITCMGDRLKKTPKAHRVLCSTTDMDIVPIDPCIMGWEAHFTLFICTLRAM